MEIENKNTEQIQEPVVKSKRGRKPSKNKESKYYFSEKEEGAVVDYNEYSKVIYDSSLKILKIAFNCNDKELDDFSSGRTLYEMMELAENTNVEDPNKAFEISELKNTIENARIENERIFNTILKSALTKMIESIMRRYKLYVPNEESGDTFNDTFSFLLTKAQKYQKDRNKKAYSYFGTICKNYINGKRDAYNKSLIRNPSYDSDETDIDVANDTNYNIVQDDNGRRVAREIVKKLMSQFTLMTDDPKKYDLKENEVKLGKALVNLFDNWDYVISTSGSNKLNKSAILFFLREQTGLDTKGIRDNMKKFQKEFLIIKKYIIE